MNTRINEFEKSAIAAAETLRNEIGAKRIVIEICVDDYEMSCKTDVSYYINSEGCDTRSRMRPRL